MIEKKRGDYKMFRDSSKEMYEEIINGSHSGLCASCENELLNYYVYVQTFEGN